MNFGKSLAHLDSNELYGLYGLLLEVTRALTSTSSTYLVSYEVLLTPWSAVRMASLEGFQGAKLLTSLDIGGSKGPPDLIKTSRKWCAFDMV